MTKRKKIGIYELAQAIDEMHDLHSCPEGHKNGICCLCEISCRVWSLIEEKQNETKA